MTGLSAFNPAIQQVAFPGGSFTVRGLALEDFTVLLRNHYEPMLVLFERYVGEAGLERLDRESDLGLNLGDMRSVVMEALDTAPALLGDVIARASDETENPHIARLLPMGVQIDAIGKIVTLTLEAEGGMEKLMGTINMLTASLSTAVKSRSR
ncbi:hypothetical protein ACM25O_13125 [Sulfitobacter pontiacus]